MIGNLEDSHYRRTATRRDFFTRAGSGLAAVALAQMLQEDRLRAATTTGVDPMDPKKPDHPPTAKSIIWLFMEGGPSHVDLFDPKPKLQELAGQPLPDSMRPKFTAMPGTSNNGLMPSKRTFKRYGQSGLWVSDWYPNIAQHVDDMTVVRSCWTDGINHLGGVTEMNSGSILSGRPSLGSWVNYGLGSANRNLPSFVVMLDDRDPIGGPKQWGSGFLPATFQGMQFRQGETPLLHLKPPNGMTDAEQRKELGLLKRLNEIWSADKQDDSELDARIRAYELAYKMQSAAPEVVDLSKESDATKKLYGMDEEETRAYGQNCLMARRLVERGVRFVQLYIESQIFDTHGDLQAGLQYACGKTDKPVAALIKDLKQRGLLDSTLIVWGGEFGRLPISQGEGKPGRDHGPSGFSVWMAGGGTKGGTVHGATDDIGFKAVENRVSVHDFHATILHLLGLNNRELFLDRHGLKERLTDQFPARVVSEILA
jgi:hypothetical protein